MGTYSLQEVQCDVNIFILGELCSSVLDLAEEAAAVIAWMKSYSKVTTSSFYNMFSTK